MVESVSVLLVSIAAVLTAIDQISIVLTTKKGKERMKEMTTFIARMIMKEADKSTAAGQKKYRAYFVRTSLYKNWKEDVDTILKTDGYEDVIVD